MGEHGRASICSRGPGRWWNRRPPGRIAGLSLANGSLPCWTRLLLRSSRAHAPRRLRGQVPRPAARVQLDRRRAETPRLIGVKGDRGGGRWSAQGRVAEETDGSAVAGDSSPRPHPMYRLGDCSGTGHAGPAQWKVTATASVNPDVSVRLASRCRYREYQVVCAATERRSPRLKPARPG